MIIKFTNNDKRSITGEYCIFSVTIHVVFKFMPSYLQTQICISSFPMTTNFSHLVRASFLRACPMTYVLSHFGSTLSFKKNAPIIQHQLNHGCHTLLQCAVIFFTLPANKWCDDAYSKLSSSKLHSICEITKNTLTTLRATAILLCIPSNVLHSLCLAGFLVTSIHVDLYIYYAPQLTPALCWFLTDISFRLSWFSYFQTTIFWI